MKKGLPAGRGRLPFPCEESCLAGAASVGPQVFGATMNPRKPTARTRLLALFLCAGALAVPARSAVREEPVSLGLGYERMYSLDFEAAGRVFSAWQRERPEDPLGPVSEAASLLFSELNRLGILEAQFFVKDDGFLERPNVKPDPGARERFVAALERADARARNRIAAEPRDADSLFALTLVSGLEADYASLIENRNIAALGPTRRATQWAEKLLAVAPDYTDAYLATGLSKYLIGSTSAPVRWILRLGGFAGDKQEGIRELELTAAHGRYLAPFARLLLTIAYLREGEGDRARRMLEGLRHEFPDNPLFAREIARLDAGLN